MSLMQFHEFMHQGITLLWIDLLWIFFTSLLVILAIVFYFLNRKNPVNRAFALLLLIIAYFSVISIVVISFQAIEAYWSILIMPVLCYLGLVFHLFVKAVLGSPTLLGRREKQYFVVGLLFSFYVAFKLLYPPAREVLRATSAVVEHTLVRGYTREPAYALYVLYIMVPIFYAALQLVRTVRAPQPDQQEMQSLARTILWIFSLSIGLALTALSVLPIMGYRQSPLLGSIALMASVIGYAWTLLRNRAWRIEALTEKLLLREAQLSERNAIIEKDLDLARAIHRKILPTRISTGSGLEYQVFYEPVEKVGGDFYDVTAAGDKTRVIVADVSGHGVAAGFFSVMSSLLLRSVWFDPARPLEQVVAFLNDQLTSYSVNGIFVSALLVQFDLESREGMFVNAGHPPACVISKSGVRELAGTGRLLGVLPDQQFVTRPFEFNPGETLLLYTDGLTEATNAEGAEFGTDRLRAILGRTAEMPAASRERLIVRELATFHGPRAYEDDLTIFQVEKKS